MSLKVKLFSMISAFVLVLSMLLVGVLAATQENLSISGNVSFVVADKSLWLERVTYQEAGGSEQDIQNFTPGYVNGNYDIDIGNITNNQHGSFKLNFYLVNVVQPGIDSIEWSISSVTIPDTLTGVTYRTSGVVSIGTTTADDLSTGMTPTIDGVLSLTIIAPNSASLDLSGIVITLGEYVEDSVIERVDEEGNPDPEGNYLLFGWYPQTVKSADVTVGSSPEANGYYLGSDGAYYMKATAAVDSDLESGYANFSDDTAIASGTDYYFKMEKLKWRVLTEDYNGTGNALIVCDTIVDMLPYRENYTFQYISGQGTYYYATDEDGTIITDPTATVGQGVDSNHQVYANNYEYSEIREYLNKTFYNTAFNAEEKSLIVTTTVDNSLESIFGSYTSESGYTEDTFNYECRDTQDNVFLLSLSDVNNTAYGYKDSYEAILGGGDDMLAMIDSARYFYTSDYSKAMGAGTVTQEMFDAQMGGMEELFGEGIIGSGAAWLRSLDGNRNGRGAYIVGTGYFGGNDVSSVTLGVVPALQIQLS